MSELDNPGVQAAIRNENRMTSVEGKLDHLITAVTQLTDQVRIQNGRVARNETAIMRIEEQFEDQETHVLTPLRAIVDSIGSQVKQLWEERVDRTRTADGRQRWWSGFKLRAETVLAILGIIGGAWAVASRFL